MRDFFKYLTYSERDLLWGNVLTVVGYTDILPYATYPTLTHPKNYRFFENHRRALSEYQIIYITKGQGYYESEFHQKTLIQTGTIIILFPGVWHCYKPDEGTGWTEYYIGLKGNIINKWQQEGFLTPEKSVVHIGLLEKVVSLFNAVFEIATTEKSGYQQLISTTSMHLLGQILYDSLNRNFAGATEHFIQQAKVYIAEHVSDKIDLMALSRQLNVSYSKFRKEFKNYTGMSPGQFQINLRINKAKELLNQRDYSLKQIASMLGFQNEYYFNTMFKQKAGVSPGEYRKVPVEQHRQITKQPGKVPFSE